MSSLLAGKKGHETIIRTAHSYDVDGNIKGGGEMTNLLNYFG